MSETPIHDVMPWPPRLVMEVEARPALELLIGLSAATSAAEPHDETWAWPREGWSEELCDAVAACGERSGEAWLHLLGLALELPRPRPRARRPARRRRPARAPPPPRRGARPGVGDARRSRIARASAEGDEAAIEALLDHPRYDAGGRRSRCSLQCRPRRRRSGSSSRCASSRRRCSRPWRTPSWRESEPRRRRRVPAARPRAARPDRGGDTRYPRPRARVRARRARPARGRAPLLLLCQHRDARIICYPLPQTELDPEAALTERAVVVGRAIGDPRVRILRRLAEADATLDELAEAAGSRGRRRTTISRGSRGRAGRPSRECARYWYALRPEGVTDAQRAIGGLARPPSR